MRTAKRLSDVLKKSEVIEFDDNSKIILMSDCHRGDGNWNDQFARNQNIFSRALIHYFNEGYTYIELGDGDELWEIKKMSDIINTHNDVFEIMSKFYNDNRLHLIYGNHDIVKSKQKLLDKQFFKYVNDITGEEGKLFSNVKIHEGLLLKHKDTRKTILLTHGHQGDLFSDGLWRVSRFLVRYIWRNLELLGIKDPTRSAKNNKAKTIIENKISKWSKDNNQMIITGHTHRPHFPKIGETLYFNDGSAVHPRCITGIEINKGDISLIKWSTLTRDNGNLYVGKDIINGPVKINEFFEKTAKNLR